MANTPVNGTQYLLSTKTGPVVSGEATWVTAVCLTSVSFETTGDDIDTSSKCTGDWSTSIPGRKGWNLSGEAQLIPGTPDTGTVSFAHYFDLWKSGVTFDAMIAKGALAADIIVRGPVKISSLPLQAPDNELATWTLGLMGQGEPVNTVEVVI